MSKNVPGLEYPRVDQQNQQLKDVLRNIYDNLFYIRRAANTSKPLTPQEINQIASQVINQVINSNTNIFNITSTSVFIVGTHVLRTTVYGAASQDVGTGFFEKDRNVVYVIVGGPKRWQFAAGIMIDTIANRPTDLGPNDASFLFFSSDEIVIYIWDGTQWIRTGAEQGYWAPLTNGDPDNPELVFDTLGNCVVVFTATS